MYSSNQLGLAQVYGQYGSCIAQAAARVLRYGEYLNYVTVYSLGAGGLGTPILLGVHVLAVAVGSCNDAWLSYVQLPPARERADMD